jgi:[ribosomal protein S5]-alanine N-acetyltransferase
MPQVDIPSLAPTIEWASLRLRGLESKDAASLLEYLTDPIVVEHTSYPVQNLGTIEALIASAKRGYAERSSCKWALARASDDALIGTCGFNSWAPEHASAELAYELAPQYWGMGLMSQAVGVVVEWAFATAGFNRLHAIVMVSNSRSSRLLGRAGFRCEGALRSYRIARGVPRDFWIYSLLRDQWAASR